MSLSILRVRGPTNGQVLRFQGICGPLRWATQNVDTRAIAAGLV